MIIFAAFPGSGIQQAARQAGAVELLAKGCPAAEIVRTVERVWSRLVPVVTSLTPPSQPQAMWQQGVAHGQR